MKKFFIVVLVLFIIKININIFAEDKINLDFESVSRNTKFIYCNNPENITKEDLADRTYNNKPTLLMKQNINKGEYDLFISLRNMTSEIKKFNREKLYVDAEFYNNSDKNLIIKINKLGFQIPQSTMQSEPVSRYRNDTSWSCINAYSDYFQKKFNASDFISDGKYDFITHIPESLPKIFDDNIIIKPGEKFWLLGDSRDERPGMLAGQVFLLLNNFKVIDGNGELKIAAFIDINKYDENAEDGHYVTDVRNNINTYRFYKGVSDGSNIKQVNLSYDIDNDSDSNIYLPVAIKNNFTDNEYELTNYWITNFNPNSAKNLAPKIAESDMLNFSYSDKNQTWFFDTDHIDFPNKTVSPDDQKSFCNLGNWGATNRYNITINNNSDYDQCLEYYIKSGSDFIINNNNNNGEVKIRTHIDTNENIEQELERYYDNDIEKYKKFLEDKKVPFVLKSEEEISPSKVLSFVIPAKQSKIISFDVTLCTNCDGKTKNSLRLYRLNQEKNIKQDCEIKNIRLDNIAHKINFAERLYFETNGIFPVNSRIKAGLYKKDDDDKQIELASTESDKFTDISYLKKLSFSVEDLNKLYKGDYGIKICVLAPDNKILAEKSFDSVYQVSDKPVISSVFIKNLLSQDINSLLINKNLTLDFKLNGLEKDDEIVSSQAYIINSVDGKKVALEQKNKIARNFDFYSLDLVLPDKLKSGNYEIAYHVLVKHKDNTQEELSNKSLNLLIGENLNPPEFSLNKQIYHEPQKLILKSENNNDIYFKINDNIWNLYSQPIDIPFGETKITAFCVDGDFYSNIRSSEVIKNYIIQK